MPKSLFPISSLSVAALLIGGAVCAQTPPVTGTAPAPAGSASMAAAPATPAPRLAPGDVGASTSVTGRVARWLPNPNGEVDGLLLDDGTQVRFPPHLSARVLAAVKLRDTVQVTGRAEAPQTPPVIRATRIVGSASGQSVGDEPPPVDGAPRAPRDHAALTAMQEGGRIAALLRTGRGDVDGVVLDSGTVVRFPPHASAGFSSLLKPSGTLYAQGYGTRNAQGSAFEATRIGSSADTAQTVFPGPRGPAAGPGGHPPPPGDGRAPAAADGPTPPAPRDAASASR